MLAEVTSSIPTPLEHDWLMLVAVAVSPIIPILITLWAQSRKEKRDAKRNLFATLMAFRKSYPTSYEWANSLNLIDVVFSDSPKVVKTWHEYYAILCRRQHPASEEERIHKYLELLSDMAAASGFHTIQQTDLDKFYTPQSHADAADVSWKIQLEWLRVLQNTAKFPVEIRSQRPIIEQPPSAGS